ncbi:hypothetical protein LZ30DRAFT_719211 [Colletotrichum cereale]|nr:hypothetical protein LZ30DRAFT_719211 [Colletotrichum cereale]
MRVYPVWRLPYSRQRSPPRTRLSLPATSCGARGSSNSAQEPTQKCVSSSQSPSDPCRISPPQSLSTNRNCHLGEVEAGANNTRLPACGGCDALVTIPGLLLLSFSARCFVSDIVCVPFQRSN